MKKINFDKKKIKVVIFDFDDTMYNISTWKNWAPYVEKMLIKLLGSKAKAEKFIVKHNINYMTNGQGIAVAMINEFGSAENMRKYLYDNIFDIWEDAEIVGLSSDDFAPIRNKYKMYVASNSQTNHVFEHMKKVGIDVSMFEGVYQNDFIKENPTKQIAYKQILERENIRPEEAVMIGDSFANDIVPAVELGMQGVWIECLDDVREIISLLK